VNDRQLWLLALLAPCLSVSSARTGMAAPATQPGSQPAGNSVTIVSAGKALNPHWVAGRCDTCHTMRGSQTLPIPVEQVDRACQACHDGRRASAEKHPTGRPAATGNTVLPPGWPAPSGRLGCATCHDLTQTFGHGPGHESRSAATPDFLRVSLSPDPLALCAKCHTDISKSSRFNPHRMLKENGQINEQSCLFCHTRAFKPVELRQRTGEPALKADVITLCVGCHTRHIDYFDPGHIGAKATPQIVAHMAEMDRAARGEAGSLTDQETAVKNKEKPMRLPLSRNHIVVCSTCHNPHEKGVFPQASVLAIGGIPPTSGPHPVPLRLEAKLCGECHAK
jgi:hypothetical protein